MNFNWFLTLKEKPLCSIDTALQPYTDNLNLATGVITRYIQQYTLNGTEPWNTLQSPSYTYSIPMSTAIASVAHKSSHFACRGTLGNLTSGTFGIINNHLCIKLNTRTTVDAFKQWLSDQYTNGTPVKMYIVNSTPTTETIPVPTGLTGTVNGSLSQSGTPTPTNPIYPTANTVEQWFVTPHYLRGTDTDTITTLPTTIYGDGTNASLSIKGNTTQSGTPSPSNPVSVVGVGELETTGEHAGQYKIPILNNSQTTNVYLGEVQTTRKIKKLVLTGQETWYNTGSTFYIIPDNDYLRGDSIYTCVSTHYPASYQIWDTSYMTQNSVTFNSTADRPRLYINDTDYSATSNFKTFLQQQYSNGTPVVVYYVLATSETGIVNEPLQKIGSYADTLSTSIATTDGANTLSIGTTVQPSEVAANYHGWHPVANAHEAENGQWD